MQRCSVDPNETKTKSTPRLSATWNPPLKLLWEPLRICGLLTERFTRCFLMDSSVVLMVNLKLCIDHVFEVDAAELPASDTVTVSRNLIRIQQFLDQQLVDSQPCASSLGRHLDGYVTSHQREFPCVLPSNQKRQPEGASLRT